MQVLQYARAGELVSAVDLATGHVPMAWACFILLWDPVLDPRNLIAPQAASGVVPSCTRDFRRRGKCPS